jgi:hypothetical protein
LKSKSKISSIKRAYGSGPYQLYLPDILSLIIFQEIGAILRPDLETDIPWSDPLFHDLVYFQPGLSPGKTPGPLMESKSRICLYPATHLAVVSQSVTENTGLSPVPDMAAGFAGGKTRCNSTTSNLQWQLIINVIVYLASRGRQ